MRSIILFGHPCAASMAYMHVDQALRDRNERNIVLAQTDWKIDQAAAHALRDNGGELWYCGPQLLPPGGEDDLVHADRHLLGDSIEKLAPLLTKALTEFLTKTRVTV